MIILITVLLQSLLQKTIKASQFTISYSQTEFNLIDYYKLRSRVYNGESGYHIVAIYKDQNNIHLAVNHGWIPLDYVDFKIGSFRYGFEGFLLNYDIKSPVGQDDSIGSEYIFRIDKIFIEI